MVKIFLAFLLLIAAPVFAQQKYWQQYLRYTINASLDDKEKSVSGFEKLVYKNNSPQALTFIWFHLYPNAYKDESTALFKQIKSDAVTDPNKPLKLKSIKYGYIDSLAFTVNGSNAATEPHPNQQYKDIVKLLLPQPLQPGDSVIITTPFKTQLPSYFSRSGFVDGEFMVCQWYPKPAVFDKNGWHEMPYLNRGEFYSEYASYAVNITLPSAYVVGATGVLQTKEESDIYRSIGLHNAMNHLQPQLYNSSFKNPVKTLSYAADSVPDFAWFADKSFIIQYDTVLLANNKITDAFTYYHNNAGTNWINSLTYVKDAARYYNDRVGTYYYPVVQAVEGPKNSTSGGMEYPTITLITEPNAKPERLDAVITHEVGHNWFMSMLGTNEREHAWMDEGLNTYYQFRYEAEKYRTNEVFGDKIGADVQKLDAKSFQDVVYKAMLQLPMQAAMELPAAQFKDNRDYSLASYIKPAEWMYLLEAKIGRQKIDECFQNYFNLWKFKHPQPTDMKAAFEQVIGGSLNQYFSLINKEGNFN